jgi:hypothetical protein
MFANTLQVRKVIRAAIKQHNVNNHYLYTHNAYTEKTSIKDLTMRSVVFFVTADNPLPVLDTVQQEFKKLGYTNKPFITESEHFTYIRCKATIA